MSLEARIRQLKPNIRDSSVKVYAANIRRLRKIDKHLEYAPISQYLKSLSAPNALNLLTSIIVLEGRERYGLLFDALAESAHKIRDNQQFTPSEREQWTSTKEIKKGIERAKFEIDKFKLLEPKKHTRGNLHTLVQYLVLRFHTEFQWRSDLPSIRLGKHKGSNYFYNGQFYLSNFKTSGYFRRRRIHLPLVFTPSRGLATLLRKFLEVRAAQGIEHDYLLFNRSLKPVQRSAYYKLVSSATFRFLGKRFGSSMFRHIYSTEFLARNPSLHDKQKKLRSMMQLQLSTFESYARRAA